MEAVETIRAYIAHNMDSSEELRAKLKSVEGELAAARKIVDEGSTLLRNIENGREATKAKARRLAEEKNVIEAKHTKVEEKNKRLRQMMQELWIGSSFKWRSWRVSTKSK